MYHFCKKIPTCAGKFVTVHHFDCLITLKNLNKVR